MNNPLSFADGASGGANPLRTARDRFAPLGPGAPSTCTAKRASALARSGWLLRQGRGAYGHPGDTLQRDACLAFLAQQVPGLHVAGKTALAWRGVRHNLAYRETVVLWGDQPARLPLGWMASCRCAIAWPTFLMPICRQSWAWLPLPVAIPGCPCPLR